MGNRERLPAARDSCSWQPVIGSRSLAPGSWPTYPAIGTPSDAITLRPLHDQAVPLGRLDNFFLNGLDNFFVDKRRLAPEIQGRRTGPAQKGEHPARLNHAANQPTSPLQSHASRPNGQGPTALPTLE